MAHAMLVSRERPDQPEILSLIAELDAYQAALYPPESITESTSPHSVSQMSCLPSPATRKGTPVAVAPSSSMGRPESSSECSFVLCTEDWELAKRCWLFSSAEAA
jgi:hypothetical protein